MDFFVKKRKRFAIILYFPILVLLRIVQLERSETVVSLN